jgi:hypothetical protein
MNFGTLGTSGNAQDGAIARITLLKTEEGVRIELAEYIPTYVVRVPDGNCLTHYIVPVMRDSSNRKPLRRARRKCRRPMTVSTRFSGINGNGTAPDCRSGLLAEA